MSRTIAELLREARGALDGRVDDPAREAELLLGAVVGSTRASLVVDADRTVAPELEERFTALVARRARGEPAAYLLGRRGFWSLELDVTPDVLVPRHETELLVELALAELADVTAPRVLDLGTGSGAVGLAIAQERPDAHVDLVDASAPALAVAERNRARLALANATSRLGDWYAAARPGERWHAIVANPPYLAADDPHLDGRELPHEPRSALVAGPTGLEDLARIARGAPAHLLPGGWLACEHGATQGEAVRELYRGAGLREVGTARDLAGHERVTFGRHAAPAAG